MSAYRYHKPGGNEPLSPKLPNAEFRTHVEKIITSEGKTNAEVAQAMGLSMLAFNAFLNSGDNPGHGDRSHYMRLANVVRLDLAELHAARRRGEDANKAATAADPAPKITPPSSVVRDMPRPPRSIDFRALVMRELGDKKKDAVWVAKRMGLTEGTIESWLSYPQKISVSRRDEFAGLLGVTSDELAKWIGD